MAKYMITEPAYVGEGVTAVYTPASLRNPATLTLPDNMAPSRRWTPLDKAAKEALSRLGVDRAIDGEVVAPVALVPDETPDTMHDAQKNFGKPVKGVRPSDKQ